MPTKIQQKGKASISILQLILSLLPILIGIIIGYTKLMERITTLELQIAVSESRDKDEGKQISKLDDKIDELTKDNAILKTQVELLMKK